MEESKHTVVRVDPLKAVVLWLLLWTGEGHIFFLVGYIKYREPQSTAEGQ